MARFAKAAAQSGKPVDLLLSLRNSSANPVQLAMLNYPAPNYRLEIEDQQHQPVQPVSVPGSGVRIKVGSGRLVEIKPKSDEQFTVNLSELYEIKKPGKYYIRAKLLPVRFWVTTSVGVVEDVVPADTIVSDWVELIIRE